MSVSITVGAASGGEPWYAVLHGWIPAVSALVAAGTFLFSVWKQREDAKLQRELEAKRRWTAFMDMAFQNPESAFKPAYTWRLLSERGERPREDIAHKNFVSRFLFTAEEVLELARDDKEWAASIKSQMDCHRLYFLKEMRDDQIECYSKSLRTVINDWRAETASGKRDRPNA